MIVGKLYLFLFKLFLFLFVLSFSFNVAFSSTDLVASIGEGSFYFMVSGDLQDGVFLDGLVPAQPGVLQEGYWTAEKGSDMIFFHDSSSIEGFRFMMSLSGEFVYLGSDLDQTNIPVDNFKIFADWDLNSDSAVAPSFGEDDLSKTVSIDTTNSCNYSAVLPYSSYYDFASDFYVGDFSKTFSISPFLFFESRNRCANEGYINFGRFDLYLGDVAAGEYSSSLYLLMLDGY